MFFPNFLFYPESHTNDKMPCHFHIQFDRRGNHCDILPLRFVKESQFQLSAFDRGKDIFMAFAWVLKPSFPAIRIFGKNTSLVSSYSTSSCLLSCFHVFFFSFLTCNIFLFYCISHTFLFYPEFLCIWNHGAGRVSLSVISVSMLLEFPLPFFFIKIYIFFLLILIQVYFSTDF